MGHNPWEPDIDLGAGHSLIWTTWSPDLDLNPQYRDIPLLAAGEYYGAIIRHPRGVGGNQAGNADYHRFRDEYLGPGLCEGGVTFETATTRALAHSPMWQVQSWAPLTISPSVLCTACGDHGFIRDGRWVSA